MVASSVALDLLARAARAFGDIRVDLDDALRLDAAGRQGVDGDAVRGDLVGQRLGPGGRRAAHGIGEHERRQRLFDGRRRAGNDAAPVPGPHGRQAQARQPDGRHQVELECALPIVVGEGVEHAGLWPAGVVEDDVDAAERVDGGFDDALQVRRAGHVGSQSDDPSPTCGSPLNLAGRGFDRRLGAGKHDHVGALSGQRARYAFAKPLASRRDDRRPAAQSKIHRPSLPKALASRTATAGSTPRGWTLFIPSACAEPPCAGCYSPGVLINVRVRTVRNTRS